MTEGTIEVHGLRCRGPRDAGGTAPDHLVDAWVRADLDRAIASDDLAEALDIAAIARTVRAVVAEPPPRPPDVLAAGIASAVLRDFGGARGVRVRVTVPRSATGRDTTTAERTLER